ncbi:MAG: flagellar filament capping protein FliD [Planctomycetaceae bacterium]|nr:flagellar filament capping protein FliD [Planctomycetaceae bacterium]
MTGLSVGTGLVSGIDFASLVDSLIAVQRAPMTRLEARKTDIQASQSALNQLQAQLLTLTVATRTLNDRNTFQTRSVAVGDPAQLSVAARLTATNGTHQFQTVKLATTHSLLSKGFSNSDTQKVGAGQLVIANGGFVDRSTALEALNGGQGVRRGTFRITDRAGTSKDIDLKNAVTIDDVVRAVNSSGVGVFAEAVDDHLVLRDTTGGGGSITVADLNGGSVAADLGIAGSSASHTLSGTGIYTATEAFSLSMLNDGNGLTTNSSGAELQFNLQDGTALAVDLDGVKTLGDVLAKITEATGNEGKLTAAIVNNRLTLIDNTTGSDAFTLSSLGKTNAAQVLGLEGADITGNELTGKRLQGGLSSPLLRNLNGGTGVTVGEISLTDRSGTTATIDLSNAETLGEVVSAINGARSAGDVKLALRAEVNANGTGIVIKDTSGSTASNLIISDVSGSLAANLNLTVDAAQTEIDSGGLNLRYVNESAKLSEYAPKSLPVPPGSFRIVDSAGGVGIVAITAADSTLGDVIDKINNSGANVTARLNATGDGFEIVDNAAGAGTLEIDEVGGSTAAGLRLLGKSVVGGDGRQTISSRKSVVIDITENDTLLTLSTKINSAGGTVRSSVVNTGSPINPFRLNLVASQSGLAGRLAISGTGTDFGFAAQTDAGDAVLRVGGNVQTAFLRTSSSNLFRDAATGLDVTVQAVGAQATSVTATLNRDKIFSAIDSFIAGYNAYVDLSKALSGFDTSTLTRGPLQGSATVIRMGSRFNGMINSQTNGTDDLYNGLSDIGITVGSTGKLSLNTDRLTAALDDNPEAVSALFTDTTSGFAKKLQDALDSYTDKFTGSLVTENEALQKTVDAMDTRLQQMELLLAGNKERLLRQFINMETILGGLQSQQQTLGALDNIISNARAAAKSS